MSACDVVAVWGCGAVGQLAARAAILLGGERVTSIDRVPERLAVTERHIGSEVIDYTAADVGAELRERTGGRGPDVCIEALGMGGAQRQSGAPVRDAETARIALGPARRITHGDRRGPCHGSARRSAAGGQESPATHSGNALQAGRWGSTPGGARSASPTPSPTGGEACVEGPGLKGPVLASTLTRNGTMRNVSKV
ncbi:zinc-binding dehydrogenase [Streptomyces antimycoticus]